MKILLTLAATGLLAVNLHATNAVVQQQQSNASLVSQLPSLLAQNSALASVISGQQASYNSAASTQAPIGSALTTSAATQIFNQLVQPGNMDFPTIQIAEYLIWEIGPPWASTPGWYVGEDYIENPLYDTIMAEYIRGLEGDAGISTQPQNIAENTLKAALQKDWAINDIMDLGNKQASSQSATQTYNALGNQSQTVASAQMGSTISTFPGYTNADGTIIRETMSAVATSKSNSVALAQTQQQMYARVTGSGTLIERAALRNEQEELKAATLQDLNAAVNTRTVMRASLRNQDLRDTNDSRELQTAVSQGQLQ